MQWVVGVIWALERRRISLVPRLLFSCLGVEPRDKATGCPA